MTADHFSPSRLVIVANEIAIGEELRERLTRLRYAVLDVGETSERALAVVERLRPNLALVDVAIKESMGGMDLADSIRRRWGIPVVLLMAHSDRATLGKARAAGFGCVRAPFTERDLLVAIEVGLGGHRLERRLDASERRFAATVDSVADGVVAASPEGRVTFMNGAAQRMTGWSSVDAIGLPSHHIVPLLDEVRGVVLPSPIDQANTSNSPVRSEAPALLVCHDGSVVPVDFTAMPVRLADGHPDGAVIAIRTRHEQVAADALRKVEAELHRAQKMEAIGRLAAGVAHDFTSILTIVAGDSEIALDDALPRRKVKELLTEIGEASTRGTSLTRSLLAFSRRQDAQSRPVGVNAAIEHATGLVSRVLGSKITLEMRLDESAGQVNVDPTQLEVVFLNLAANARDAMPDGGTLIISTRMLDTAEDSARPGMPAGRYVVIDVEDQGTGMSAAVASRAFEPFFTTKSEGLGTGIGLATVHNIAKRFGAYVYVQSAVGVGSRFSIYLPATHSAGDAGASVRAELRGRL